MADVYVAFVRDDQSYAEALAVALQGSGFTVSRSASVVDAIDECGAIVVLWTPAAARSKLFIDAADRAFRSGKMVLARMGTDPLPQMFAGVEAHSLARWSGDPDSPEIDEIMFQVDRLVNRSRPRRPEANREQAPPARERGTVHRFPSGGGATSAARATRPMDPPPAPYAQPPQPYAQPTPSSYAPPAASAYAPPGGDPLAEEAAFWRRIQHSPDPEQFYAYLERYGRNGTFAELAESRVRALSSRPLGRGGAPAPAPQYHPPMGPGPAAPPSSQGMLGTPSMQGSGRGNFNMNPPVARQPAPGPAARLDPHPARSRPAPAETEERSGGGARLLAVLLFLAIIGGGGFYVYQQLSGGTETAGSQDPGAADADWTPPPGSPAEPEGPSGTSATEAAQAASKLPAGAATKRTPPAGRQEAARRETAPLAAETPPPAPVFRILQPETPPVVREPAPLPGSPAAIDPQMDVSAPAVAVAPAPAPQAAPSAPVKPRWAKRPTRRDLQDAYPAAAQRRNLSGNVSLDCLIGNDLAIRCRVVSESPTGFGFGTAALRVAQQFRSAPTLEDGRPAAGQRAQLSIGFRPDA